MTINLQFVYGAGNDNWFGAALRALRDDTVAKYRDKIYCPRILDWTEYATLDRLVAKWQDPTMLIGHSCGNSPITHTAVKNSMKRIPFIMVIAPSMYCGPVAVGPNVSAICQATSWWGDFFNPGGRQLIGVTSINHKTAVSTLYTGLSHLNAPSSPLVRNRLWTEIDLALKGAK